MRKPTKFRLLFFVVAIFSYVIGSYVLPETLSGIASLHDFYTELFALNNAALGLLFASLLFFVVVPTAYWFLVIQAGSQARWKIIITLSLSIFIARYQFPTEIAAYFYFIVWLRYPLIALLLALEFYLMFSVGRSLWNARKISGDPRINVLNNYDEGSKEQSMGLMLAYEPAAWYYAISKFSRNHEPSIGQLKLLSANPAHFIAILAANISFIFIAYSLLVNWSELAAIVAATVLFSTSYMLIANYRCSKYYSIYPHEGKLIINNSWWGFIAIELDNINVTDHSQSNDSLRFGQGKPNLKLSFTKEQTYYSGLGLITEKVNEIELCLHDAQSVLNYLTQNLKAMKSGDVL